MKQIVLCCVFLCFLSCSSQESNSITTTNDDSIIYADGDNYIGKEIHLVDFIDFSNCSKDEYSINKVFIENDRIYFNISYAGGCQLHEFSLLVEKEITESIPVETNIFLSHNANDDSCETFFTKELSFDLTPLKEQIKYDYAKEFGTININIKSTDNTFQKIEYTF